MSLTVNDHLFGDGPKRILALDGGGIRGILSIQIIRRLEKIVRTRTGRGDAVLSDYFDLIGGTSTGAIIAAGLALGWEVDKLDELYRSLGNSIFRGEMFRKGLFRPKFSAKPLRKALEQAFGDTTLGSPDLKTGLAVVAKRLDTGSPWVLHNNPQSMFFDAPPGSDAVPNKDFLLRRIVRASTAAPHYFQPEKIEVNVGQVGAFVDGGISPHNNPALLLLLLATVGNYGYGWPLGSDQLLLVSIGTGSMDLRMKPGDVMDMKAIELAGRSLASIMDDASDLNETVLQWLSTSPTAREIDVEIGDLRRDVPGGAKPWLTYLRYDTRLESGWLKDTLGLEVSEKELESLAKMDKPENMDQLVELGKATTGLIDDDHLPAVFDPAGG